MTRAASRETDAGSHKCQVSEIIRLSTIVWQFGTRMIQIKGKSSPRLGQTLYTHNLIEADVRDQDA